MEIVTINGIKYIPAKETMANTIDIAKGLLMECMGVCNEEDTIKYMNDPDITVYVNDCGEGVPLSKIIDNIAEVAEDK